MAQNDIIELSHVTTVNGQNTANVMHLEQTSSNPTDLQALYQDVRDAYVADIIPDWQARTSDEATFECLKVQVISPTRQPAAYFTENTAGGVFSPSMPAINCIVHAWYSQNLERRGIGRKFWSGIPESAASRNRVIQAQLQLEGQFGILFQDPLNAAVGTYEFGIWSSKFLEFTAMGIVQPRIVIKNVRTRRPVQCV